jgi:antitoxin MazE
MYTSIQRWGNSNAVRLPKTILDALNMRESDKVEIITESHQIVIRPVKRKYTSLDEIFENYTGDYLCEEADTGVFGREVL